MIELTEKGLFCGAGGFHIDPSRAVEIAVVTHAHSDHARKGSKLYYCAETSARLLQQRLGNKARIIGIPYRKPFELGGVRVSFHPAGHMLGSAQVRVDNGNEVWVASGDYKRAPDPTCEPFEVIECDTFITEATFGNPRYRWDELLDPAAEIFNWWESNRDRGLNSVLFCYSMGKAQRVLAALKKFTNRQVLIFGETVELTEIYRLEGVEMVPTLDLEKFTGSSGSRGNGELRGELIVAPHALARARHPFHDVSWMDLLEPFETAFASGWMQTGAFGLHARYDRGFVLSDHADWPGLLSTISQTRARRVLVLHAAEGKSLVKHLTSSGVEACFMKDAGRRAGRSGGRGGSTQLSLFD